METLTLGFLASLLSAATALIVAFKGAHGVHPLWLLLAQYTVGVILSPPKKFPIIALKFHILRLFAGLWAFGAYYFALATAGALPSEMSMILNTAPVFVTFFSVRDFKSRLGAILAFLGVAATLSSKGMSLNLTHAHFLALTAAGAYAFSFVMLGFLAKSGEAPSTTNAFYNFAAGLCIGLLLIIIRPALPFEWWPVFAVGIIAAARIEILTRAATDPIESARVSVLTNLAFIWLAIVEVVQGVSHGPWEGVALVFVVVGVGLNSDLSSFTKNKKSSVDCAPCFPNR
jgi:drug/metabolite transporter (DMT)-like permease